MKKKELCWRRAENRHHNGLMVVLQHTTYRWSAFLPFRDIFISHTHRCERERTHKALTRSLYDLNKNKKRQKKTDSFCSRVNAHFWFRSFRIFAYTYPILVLLFDLLAQHIIFTYNLSWRFGYARATFFAPLYQPLNIERSKRTKKTHNRQWSSICSNTNT